MTPVVIADAPPLIWLIVGLFWVIAQIAGAAAKKKMPPRPADSGDDAETPPNDPFAELLRKIGEAQRVDAPKPLYEELPEEELLPEPPVQQKRTLADTGNLPDIKPLRRETPAQASVAPPLEIAAQPSMASFRSTLPVMKLPSVPLSFRPLEKPAGRIRNSGPGQGENALGSPKETTRRGLAAVIGTSGPQSLRRAMLGHIIFSPPKALE
jgi:hypothetical protein